MTAVPTFCGEAVPMPCVLLMKLAICASTLNGPPPMLTPLPQSPAFERYSKQPLAARKGMLLTRSKAG